MDTFVQIPDFPGYFINKNGEILSKMKCKTGRIRKTYLNPIRGYYTVGLRNDNKPKPQEIHRLLALTFIANPENLPCVDHIDRCKTNNKLENLRWASSATNRQNSKKCFNNKSGYKHIHLWINKRNNTYYIFKIIKNGKLHRKYLKTIEEAIKYRNEYLTNLGEEII